MAQADSSLSLWQVMEILGETEIGQWSDAIARANAAVTEHGVERKRLKRLLAQLREVGIQPAN